LESGLNERRSETRIGNVINARRNKK